MEELKTAILVIKELKKFVCQKNNKRIMEYNQYIDRLYDDTKEIVDDYYTILKELEIHFSTNDMTIDEVIVYLEESRIPFKSLRAYVGCFIEKGYYKPDDNMERFLRGILGVLQGGLEKGASSPQKYISDTFNNHTILALIWKCELLREEENPDELREILLGYIKIQLHELEKAWKLVCNSYIDMKGLCVEK